MTRIVVMKTVEDKMTVIQTKVRWTTTNTTLFCQMLWVMMMMTQTLNLVIVKPKVTLNMILMLSKFQMPFPALILHPLLT